MKALADSELERLADLFGQGKLTNASEIARTLKSELGIKRSVVSTRSLFEVLFSNFKPHLNDDRG